MEEKKEKNFKFKDQTVRFQRFGGLDGEMKEEKRKETSAVRRRWDEGEKHTETGRRRFHADSF
jgi:hypothetical protein